MKRLNLINQKFGELIVLEFIGIGKFGQSKWLCLCSCGNKVEVLAGNLKKGSSKSCGCVSVKKTIERCTTHGCASRKSRTAEYNSWIAMINRCYKEYSTTYKSHGGRGIAVCDSWIGKDGFINFLKDMGHKPSPQHSIDRIDNDKGYSPENCRWATKIEQANNTRKCVQLLNVHTGIYYTSISDAARSVNEKVKQFNWKLLKNKSSFIRV